MLHRIRHRWQAGREVGKRHASARFGSHLPMQPKSMCHRLWLLYWRTRASFCTSVTTALYWLITRFTNAVTAATSGLPAMSAWSI